MIKLLAATALLFGANAVQTTLEDMATLTNIANANITYLGALTAIPKPDPNKEKITLAYWSGNPKCQDLFQKIINTRQSISTTIDTYIQLVALYNKECNPPHIFIKIHYRYLRSC